MNDDLHSLFDAANQQMTAGDLLGAEMSFRQMLDVAPECAEAHGNLALLLERRGAPAEETELHYLNALNLNPWIPQTYLNYGAFLHRAKRLEEAEQIYRHALIQIPESPQAWSNLGALYACLRQDDQAEQCCRMALSIDDQHASAHFNLAYVLLRQGRWEEGWQHFEKRPWHAGWAGLFPSPRWQGEALAGKRIVVIPDGGLGDLIQCSRYFALMKAAGAASISLICPPTLAPLLRTAKGLDEVITTTPPPPADAWDYWVPVMSLPACHGTLPDAIPATLPYLHADPSRTSQWRSRLPSAKLRVGLAWKGNPNFENDDQRSLPSLDVLAPLGEVPDVAFISLQKGRGEEEAANPPSGLMLTALGAEFHDMADTAAVVSQLDLIITVDTAIAHLAAALGKPCWVLLPEYKTDWRWLMGRDETPWYPGVMRLFSQSTMGDWTKPIDLVREALKQRVLG